MKPIALSIACALIAAASMAVAARPASAGLEFTDTATSGSGGTADFTFNSSTTIGTSVSMLNTFGGPTNATISSNLASGAVAPTLARVVFSYTGAFGGIVTGTYSNDVGNPPYNMVIEFGAITLGGTFATLQAIDFDEGAGFLSVYNINQTLTGANANNKLFINVPALSIPLSERDLVRSVRLTFLFNGGSGTSINVTAVVNPEPGTVALFGLGLIGLAGAVGARRRSRRADGARAQNA